MRDMQRRTSEISLERGKELNHCGRLSDLSCCVRLCMCMHIHESVLLLVLCGCVKSQESGQLQLCIIYVCMHTHVCVCAHVHGHAKISLSYVCVTKCVHECMHVCVFTGLTELYLFTCYTDGMFQSKFPFKDNKVLSYHIVYFLMDK